jgi:hypothetical protein
MIQIIVTLFGQHEALQKKTSTKSYNKKMQASVTIKKEKSALQKSYKKRNLN